MKKLKYKPISIAKMLRKTEIISIELSLWDNKNEIAPGRINKRNTPLNSFNISLKPMKRIIDL